LADLGFSCSETTPANSSFGAMRLDKLRPSDVEALVLAMRAKTKPAAEDCAEPVRALSDSTIRQTYTVLRSALDGAVRDGLLARTPWSSSTPTHRVITLRLC
jgi:hypothetical protein